MLYLILSTLLNLPTDRLSSDRITYTEATIIEANKVNLYTTDCTSDNICYVKHSQSYCEYTLEGINVVYQEKSTELDSCAPVGSQIKVILR